MRPEWFQRDSTTEKPRQPQPGEMFFEFYRERDHTRWLCELRQHPKPCGVEAQFYWNEQFHSSPAV